MCRYMTFARVFLILSIINFAQAAPALVQEVHKVHVDVMHVAEDGRVKRWEPWLTNVADPNAPNPGPGVAILPWGGRAEAA